MKSITAARQLTAVLSPSSVQMDQVLQYLRSVSPRVAARLWQKPEVAAVVIRALPILAQQCVMRMVVLPIGTSVASGELKVG
jgi:hypothetical protein